MLIRSIEENPVKKGLRILDEAAYLTMEEAAINPLTVPIISLYEGSKLVEYEYLKRMMLEVGVDINEAKSVLAEVNDIDPSSIITVIPEYEMLINPYLSEDAGNFVLTSISSDSDAYFFCETIVSLYEETMDESYLALLLEDEKQDFIRRLAMDSKLTAADRQKAIESWERKEQADKDWQQRKKEEKIQQAKDRLEAEKKRAEEIKKQKQAIEDRKKQHEAAKKQSDKEMAERKAKEANMSFPEKAIHAVKKKWMGQSNFTQSVLKKAAIAAGAVGAGGLAYGINSRLQRIRAEAANQPRTWLAKKIAALRSIYSNYLNRARMERAQDRAGIFKTIASKILGVIDFLMKKLQHAAN